MAIQGLLWCNSQRTLGGSSNKRASRCTSVGRMCKGIVISVIISFYDFYLPGCLNHCWFAPFCV
jgi:hypothetical protein